MIDITDSISDDTEALTVRPGLWPIWVGAADERQVALWVVVGGFTIGDYWVEDGFVTDLATIPWLFRWLLNPYAPDTAVPAAGHDWLLTRGVEERIAAGMFYAAMAGWGTPRWKRVIYFLAVIAASRGW